MGRSSFSRKKGTSYPHNDAFFVSLPSFYFPVVHQFMLVVLRLDS
jgi:hypothetical protein